MSEVHEHGNCNVCRRRGCAQIAALQEENERLNHGLDRVIAEKHALEAEVETLRTLAANQSAKLSFAVADLAPYLALATILQKIMDANVAQGYSPQTLLTQGKDALAHPALKRAVKGA